MKRGRLGSGSSRRGIQKSRCGDRHLLNVSKSWFGRRCVQGVHPSMPCSEHAFNDMFDKSRL